MVMQHEVKLTTKRAILNEKRSYIVSAFVFGI